MGDPADNESGDSASVEPATMKRVSKRKQGLFERLRIKLNRPSSSPEETETSPQCQNAVKSTKKVGIGLMKYDPKRGSYFQVRTKSGGGTRNVPVPKQATKSDLLCQAKSLFFPGGQSVKFGLEADYYFDLMDYQFVTLEETITVKQLSELTGLSNLRFYLAMKPKVIEKDTFSQTSGAAVSSASTNQPIPSAVLPITQSIAPSASATHSIAPSASAIQPSSQSASATQPSAPSASATQPSAPSASATQPSAPSASATQPSAPSASATKPSAPSASATQPSAPSASATQPSAPSDSTTQPNDPLSLTTIFPVQLRQTQDHSVFHYETENHGAKGGNSSSSSDDELPNILPLNAHIDDTQDSFDILDDFLANFEQHQPEVRQHTIRLHRGHVFGELKADFKMHTYDFDKDVFNFQMILPNGDMEVAEDNGGVMRDALVEFWDSFFEQCCLGNICKVPFIRHDYDYEEWQAIARVLYLGWKHQKYFPISLAKSFMSCCIFGMDTFATSKESIIPEYLSSLPISESETLKSALDGGFDEEELVDVLSVHECRVLPTRDNIKRLIGEIAHKELIQQPMYVKGAWYEQLTLLKFNLGDTSLDDMYESLQPNPRKVVKMLSFPDDMSQHQTVTADFLRKYVRELEKASLRRFLRFCTGAHMCLPDVTGVVKPIFVRFSSISGLARRPVAHTCGQVLELPHQYDNYMDFRTEFNLTLDSGVWLMDYV